MLLPLDYSNETITAVHPRTLHKRSEREEMNSTLSLTSAVDDFGWSTPRPDHFTSVKDPLPTVQEAGCAPGQVRTCAANVAHLPTGIRSAHRPVSSESLCRLPQLKKELARLLGGVLSSRNGTNYCVVRTAGAFWNRSKYHRWSFSSGKTADTRTICRCGDMVSLYST